MIKVHILSIRPIKEDKVHITWKFSQTVEDFRDYSFVLERSESPESGYKKVLSFDHITEAVDDIRFKKIWRDLVYRIKTIRKADGEEWCSQPMIITAAPNLEALEIVRRNDILLKNRRHGTGRPIAIFKRKTIGPSCQCWDSNKQRPRTSNCNYCYGSHIEGGYYYPIISWANMSPPQKVVQIPQWGEMEPNEVRIFMNNYPLVNPKDIIFVPASMLFYTVEKVETTTRREFILHQVVGISGLDRSHISYKLLDEYPDLVTTLRDEESRIKTS